MDQPEGSPPLSSRALAVSAPVLHEDDRPPQPAPTLCVEVGDEMVVHVHALNGCHGVAGVGTAPGREAVLQAVAKKTLKALMSSAPSS